MKLLVCVKYVPSVTEGIRMDENHSLVRDGVIHRLNVADESAVELALRLRGEGSVTVMSMGKAELEDGMRELLAKGVDDAVLLTDRRFAGADTYATARTLAGAVSLLRPFDLILCGRRAVDGETGQVPAELAAMLGAPCVTNVTAVTAVKKEGTVENCRQEDTSFMERLCMEENGFLCTRLVENGTMELLAPKGTVISLCEYSYILRNAGIKGRREAGRKKVRVLSAGELGIAGEDCGLRGSPTRVKRVERQTAGRRHVKLLEKVEELAERLKEEMD